MEPAVDLVNMGDLNYICFDAMSEVTMSIAQAKMLDDPDTLPYDPDLIKRITPILELCLEKDIKIITNSGWLDPVAAAAKVIEHAKNIGIKNLKIATVTGSNLGIRVADLGVNFIETGTPVNDSREQIISGEVYLGAEGIVEGLKSGANIIITGRIGDSCMYLAALAHEFGWSFENPNEMAKGMIIGHLMECGSQITGGCFADPGYKDVPDIANLGNPIAEVTDDRVIITKIPTSGGTITEATCKEQLLYEVHDPSCYYCPDVIADLSKVTFSQISKDTVEVIIENAGIPKTSTLKALIGLREGFIAEELVLFAGPGAIKRAELTKHILNERFNTVSLLAEEIRWDFVGLTAVHREASPAIPPDPYEVILRVAVKTQCREQAAKLGAEIDAIAVNGPAGVGKWGTHSPGSRIRPVIGLNSALIPRKEVPFSVRMFES